MNITAANIWPMGKPSKASPEERLREGSALRHAMKSRGVKQLQIADEWGVEQNLISQWCTGKTRIPDLDLLKLGERLNFDPISVRPALKEYKQYFENQSLFEGLTDSQKTHIKAVIHAFKKSGELENNSNP